MALSLSLSLTSFSSWKLSWGWKEWTWLAGLGVWGGRRQKTPSRFSSNSCLWFVASSQSLSVCVSPLPPPPGFPPCFISSCFSVSPHLFAYPVSLQTFHLSDSSLCQHLCLSISPCPSPSVRLSRSVCAWVSLSICSTTHLSVLVLLKGPTLSLSLLTSSRSAKASSGSGWEGVETCSFWLHSHLGDAGS